MFLVNMLIWNKISSLINPNVKGKIIGIIVTKKKFGIKDLKLECWVIDVLWQRIQ
jgi:hypothetical protein